MLIRIVSTFAMLGTMQAWYTSGGDSDEEKMGGEGMGGVFATVTFVALTVLVVIIVLGILSLMGQFESSTADPVT